MKIKQIIPAPPKLTIVYNAHELVDGQSYMVGVVEDVRAYGLLESGAVVPLVENQETGRLEPIDGRFVRTCFEGAEDE